MVFSDLCSGLEEFDRHWTLADLCDAIAILDWKQQIEADQAREIEERAKWRR